MNDEKVEQIVRNVTAIMSFEGFELTEQNQKDMRRVASGEATDDEVVAEIIQRYRKAGVIK